MGMKKIYLDYAAATPVDEAVLSAMQPYFTDLFYNPSALYLGSKSVVTALSEARKGVAGWLGARSGEVVFTAGGTEANNLAIQGVMRAYPDGNMLLSAIEHESVSRPGSIFSSREVAVDATGVISIEDLERKIDDKTVLVSIMYANNEIGVIEPLAQVARVLKKVRLKRQQSGNRLPLYFHTDACQAANYLSLQIGRLGVDMMTLNGGKIYGPKQSGVLFVASHVVLQPLILGGGQERGLRSGTENVPAAIGFATALNLVQTRRAKECVRLAAVQKCFFDELARKLPQAVVNGSMKSRLVNNVNILMPGEDNERMVMALDAQGVLCASGSACSALMGESSHVLKAIGLDDVSARSSLRFTLGITTDEAAVYRTVDLLAKIVA